MVKNLPAMWEAWFQSLGWEDCLEEGMATHSSILAWRSPMDTRAWWATVTVRHNQATKRGTMITLEIDEDDLKDSLRMIK